MGIMGFSFGVTHALQTATDPDLRQHLAAVAGFGGYCDFERTLHFLLRGEHEWQGEAFRGDPDPYGRWVVGGNLLPETPGFEGTEPVAEALLTLARAAGDEQVGAWEATFDHLKGDLEESLAQPHREIFRALAPPSGEVSPQDFIQRVTPGLARSAQERGGLVDPRSLLAGVRLPVRLIHGREDRLIPFTETLRLEAAFPHGADVRVYLTGLFAHSQRETTSSALSQVREQLQFVRMLADLLGMF